MRRSLCSFELGLLIVDACDVKGFLEYKFSNNRIEKESRGGLGMALVTVDLSSPLGESKARDIARAEAAESLKCSGDSGLHALPPIIVTAARSTSELSVFAKDTNDKVDLSAKEGQNTDDASNDELCETPKSEEHRIPEVISCPPAPRKPRPTLGIKRKAPLSPRKLYIPPDLELLFANSKNPNSQRRAKETRTALRI